MNRRNFIKQAVSIIASLPFIPSLLSLVKTYPEKTFGGWFYYQDDGWHFEAITSTHFKFPDRPISCFFVSEPLEDEVIEQLYQQSRKWFE